MATRRVLALALRIARQFIGDPRTLALLFLAPLLIMTILNFVLNGSSSGITLGIVAPDGTAGTAVLSSIQTQLQGNDAVHVTNVARDRVDATLRDGNADGVLVFPASFGGAASDPSAITLRLDGSSPNTARQLRALVTPLVAALAASQRAQQVGQAPPAATTPANGSATTPQPTLNVSYLYAGPQYTQTDALAPLLVGLFAFFFVFLLTSVSFLRERSQGTIERLMVSPLSKTELVLGYVLGFLLFAMAQSLVILLFVIYVLRVHYAGNLGLLFLVTVALTVGGVNLGIFASALARNELQVIQFIPVLLVPQVLLGGLFFPVATLPVVLKQIAYVMPLTYANAALKDVMLKGLGFETIWPDLLVLTVFAAVMIVASAFSLRGDRV